MTDARAWPARSAGGAPPTTGLLLARGFTLGVVDNPRKNRTSSQAKVSPMLPAKHRCRVTQWLLD